ncbi:MAG: hypothetical protein JO352_09040 [Chloroflexi bacterium]|nr:hypothetical protein [Chloroflexota bacterium]
MHRYADEVLARAAGRVWAEGRANPIEWEIHTRLGVFTTQDRATWRTQSGDWTAELRRSKNGRHFLLALFEGGVYRGRYDATGWHRATERRRIRQLRTYPLPLVA